MTPPAFSLLGLPVREDGVDRDWFYDLVHPDDRARLAKASDQLLRKESDSFSSDHRLRAADGSYKWVQTSGHLINREAEGLPPILYGSLVEITARKNGERRLAAMAEEARQARDRLNALADNAPGALFEFRMSPDHRIDLPFFSAKLPDLLGVDRSALLDGGANGFANIHPEDLSQLKRQFEASLTKLTPVMSRYRVNHPERGMRWLVASSLPEKEPDGSVLWRCSLVDITEQINAERRAAEASSAWRAAHERLSTVTENAPCALFSFRRDRDGTISYPYFTSKMADIFGVTCEDIERDATAPVRHMSETEKADIEAAFKNSAYDGARLDIEQSLNHPERGPVWFRALARAVTAADGSITWHGHVVDITEARTMQTIAELADERVQQAHDRLVTVAELAPVGLYEAERDAKGNLKYTFTSSYFEELVGFTKEEIQELQTGIFERIHPDDLPQFLQRIEETSENLTLRRQRFRIFHREKGLRWLDAAAKPVIERNGVVTWRGALYDVTSDVEREVDLRLAHDLAERMRVENEWQALHDGLTGLPNRRYFDRVFAETQQAACEGGTKGCALIRIDLDHFKYVNDTLGHEAGDQVLMRVGEVLRTCIRKGDFAARIGGDEFAILLGPAAPPGTAQQIVELIRDRLHEPFFYLGRPCRFGASFGIAQSEDITEPGSDLQLYADAALYRAKDSGRNRVEVFTKAMHESILNDHRIASELHEALERDEFVPFFQPQVCANEGTLVGVETLLRWRHPTKGVLAPAAFMRVAEQLRLVPELDRLMMQKTRETLQRWRKNGLLIPKISFNVSSGRMHDPDVVSAAREMIADNTAVTFELLESILVEEESDTFRKHLREVREAGIEIEIDDFGSGHASIIGLMEIAPSALKIDRRIVEPVAHDPRSRNLLRAIVEIAEALGIQTISEGVETEKQARFLRALGCEVLQGYLFSAPVDEQCFFRFATRELRRTA